MRWIHRDSLITCGHDGRVGNRPSHQVRDVRQSFLGADA